MQQAIEALCQQAGAYQQNHRDRQFDDDQACANSAPAPASRRAATLHEALPACLTGRAAATGPAAEENAAEVETLTCEEQEMQVEMERLRGRACSSSKAGGICPGRILIATPCKCQADETSAACEQEAFHRELENESSAPCSSAPRTAISRLRLSALTSSRLETLTKPIRDRSPAPASSAISVGRISPRIDI